MKANDTLGRYSLVSRLARGGMGEVWLATVSGSGGFTKEVVIKAVLPERAGNRMFVDMLAGEARICGKLSHPNLIEVFDFIDNDDVCLIAMEYVVGRSIAQIARAAHKRGEQIPPWFALRVLWESCLGLDCAHANNIIHCDLSSGNIMVSFTGTTKVLDFGVAQGSDAGGAGPLKVKYHYMAPERIKTHVADRRTDIYALGVLMYGLFTGRWPYVAPDEAALAKAILDHAPPPPSA